MKRVAGVLGGLLSLAVLAGAGPAAAQALGGLSTGDGPLEIFADEGIEWLRDERKYVARGNALARQGDTQVSGDVLTAFYREAGPSADSEGAGGSTEIYRIEAQGNVVVAAPDQTAYSERAVYFVDEQVAVLRGGDLRFVTPEQTVTATESLEYWENYQGTAIAVARGDATAITPERRVEADELVATLQPDETGRNEIVQIDAFGDVEIFGEGDYANGERGVYYVKEDVAVLAGNVQITQGETQLSGQRAQMDMANGVSRLLPASGGRVRGLLVPQGEDDTDTGGQAGGAAPAEEDAAQ